MLKRIMGVGLVVCVLAVAAAPAWATIQNLKSYKQAYPDKDPKTVSCKTCHEAAVGKAANLNAYGLSLQKSKGAGNAKALTVEDFKTFDKAAATEKQNATPADAPAPSTTPSSSTANPTKTP